MIRVMITDSQNLKSLAVPPPRPRKHKVLNIRKSVISQASKATLLNLAEEKLIEILWISSEIEPCVKVSLTFASQRLGSDHSQYMHLGDTGMNCRALDDLMAGTSHVSY